MTFRGRRAVRYAVVLCVLGTLAATPAPAAGQSPRKRVLLLFDEDRTLPGLSILDQKIRSTLSAGLGDGVEFFTESMHAAQFSEEQHELAQRDYFLKKYGSTKAGSHRRRDGTRVAVPAAPWRHVRAWCADRVLWGRRARPRRRDAPGQHDWPARRRVFAPTLDIALRLRPDTREVYVVGGTSEFDRNLQAAARREFEPFERRLSFTYLTDLPMKDLLTAVSSVSPRSVILYLSLFRDGAGQTFVPHDAASRFSAASSAPVYVFVDQYLGLGPVGGYLYSLELHGNASAELGLRVLRGESPAAIPVREVPGNQYMFDSRQLSRWTLDSRLLPADSVIKFREPSAWDLYRVYIIGGVALLTVQTGLIVGLLVHRARLRRAESELRASFARIRELGRRILTAQETERTRIARELHDDISQHLTVLNLDLHQLAGMVQGPAETVVSDAVKYADDIATSVRNLSHQLVPGETADGWPGKCPRGTCRRALAPQPQHHLQTRECSDEPPARSGLVRLPHRAGGLAECAQAQSSQDDLRAPERYPSRSRRDRCRRRRGIRRRGSEAPGASG